MKGKFDKKKDKKELKRMNTKIDIKRK